MLTISMNLEPVAKNPDDRTALLRAAASGNPKFFLGSDSAPHSLQAKQGGPTGISKHAAGVFTSPYVVPLVLDAFVEACRSVLDADSLTMRTVEGFLSRFGRSFYQEPTSENRIVIGQSGRVQIQETIRDVDKGVTIVPFRRNECTWQLTWTRTGHFP